MRLANRLDIPMQKILTGLVNDPSAELERELPYAAMMVTLMSASGITPYDGFRRLRTVDSLPVFKNEAKTLVREVEVLGKDPLTAMENRAALTRSENYRDFLEGYVSSVKSGGSVVSFLKSKLRSIFEVRVAQATNAIEQIETLVEVYMVMLIVVLCLYILVTLLSAPSLSSAMGGGLGISTNLYPVLLISIPLISFFFMYLAHNMRRGTLLNLNEPYRRTIIPLSASIVLFVFSMLPTPLHFVVEVAGVPLLVCICLVIASIPPGFSYISISRSERSAETAMPSFLRDVTEARKTGLSPEKSIAHAAKRRTYGPFSAVLRRITNQIEWGVSLRKILEELKASVKS